MLALEIGAIFAGAYELLYCLGQGGFAEVWKAKYILGNSDGSGEEVIVALKIYAPQAGLDANGIQTFQKEFAKTHNLNQNHILKAHHFDIYRGRPYLVMPFCEEGSLYDNIINDEVYSEKQVAVFIKQVGSALAHIHSKHIAHQDIKPANILVRSKDDYVIADFGISSKVRRTIRQTQALRESIPQTYSAFAPAYAPPERYVSRPSPAGDIFSFGVTIYEMCMGDLPFEDTGQAVNNNGRLPEMPAYSPELNRLIQDCTRKDPDKRPDAATLVEKADNFLTHGKWKGKKNTVASSVLLTLVLSGIAAAAFFWMQPEPVPIDEATIKYEEQIKLGKRQMEDKAFFAANSHFKQSLEYKPDGAEARQYIEICEAQIHKYEAIAQAIDSLIIQHKCKEAKAKIAGATAIIPSKEEALSARVKLCTAKPKQPSSTPNQNNLFAKQLAREAQQLVDAGEWHKAAAKFKQAKKADKSCCIGSEAQFVNMAKRMERIGKINGDYSEAIRFYNYAYDINPSEQITKKIEKLK